MTRSAAAPRPDLCVAICTRGRPEMLRRALASLHSQTRPPREILVVDNAPSDDRTRALVERGFPQARYVREPVLGLDFARNRALREARTEIVAFLDDDAVASANWVAALLQVFEDGERIAVCTGRVEALSLATPGARLFEANGGFAKGTRRVRLPHDASRPLHGRPAPLIAWTISIGVGCSLAVRREVALALGGFDEALDLGAALPGGGDHDLVWRALQAGYEVVYEPVVQVWHEHRPSVDAAAAQIVGQNRAMVALLTKCLVQSHGRARLPLLAFLVWRLAKPGVRLLARLRGRDPLPATVLLRLWGSSWLGVASYWLGAREARRRKAALAGTVAGEPELGTANP